MLAKTIVITGANRGLGLELTRQLCLISPKSHIIATCRQPQSSHDLLALKSDNLSVLKLDVSNVSHISAFVDDLANLHTVNKWGVGLIVNNAGISPGLTRLHQVKSTQMMDCFNTNVIGPLMIVQALLPMLKKAAAMQQEQNESRLRLKRPLVFNMSSILGSIKDNDRGGIYPYRASKAALNMITRSMSVDLASHNIDVVAMHPGWVKTSLGGPHAPLEASESVSGMLDFLQDFRPEYSGNFYDYLGQKVPW